MRKELFFFEFSNSAFHLKTNLVVTFQSKISAHFMSFTTGSNMSLFTF